MSGHLFFRWVSISIIAKFTDSQTQRQTLRIFQSYGHRVELYGNMEIWKHGNMEIWKYGSMEKWKYGKMEIWKHRNLEIWNY